jgi:hypothetical protein
MMPPLPPNVTAQQAPPQNELAYLRSAGGVEQAGQGGDWGALVKQRLTQIIVLLKDVADVLSVHRPALLSVPKIMIQAGSKLMSDVSDGIDNQPAPGADQVQPQNPSPGSATGMVSMG